MGRGGGGGGSTKNSPFKSEKCSRPRARGPETAAPQGSSSHLRSHLGPDSPVKGDLAAGLSAAAPGREGGVCTRTMRSRAPHGSFNMGFVVSGFGWRRPEMRLEQGSLRPQARTFFSF